MHQTKTANEWVKLLIMFLLGTVSGFGGDIILGAVANNFTSTIVFQTVGVAAGVGGVIFLLLWRISVSENALRLANIEAGLRETKLRSEFREKLLKAS